MNAISTEPKGDAMNRRILQTKLDELREQLRELHRRQALVKILCSGAVLAGLLALAGIPAGWPSLWIIEGLGAFMIAAGLIAILRVRSLKWSSMELARMIEAKHPELDALLLTAVEQIENGEESLLGERLLQKAAEYGVRTGWATAVARPALQRSNWMLTGAAVLCALAAGLMFFSLHRQERPTSAGAKEPTLPSASELTMRVTPGDTEVERGGRLIVEARFAKDVPAEATLVVSELTGGDRERIPMRLTVDQQVFGGLIAKVDKDARYRVEFGNERSEDYRITTYLFPALVQADVKITPPVYAGLPSKEIKNTLKVAALQSSELLFTLKINKPVKQAELFGEDRAVLPLIASAIDPTVLTATMRAEKSQKWRLHLVDDKDRANKNPPWLSVTVLANQLAKIEIVFPKRDLQISALQEMPVEAKIWDDVSVTKSGANFNIAGKMQEVIFKHPATAPGKKEDVSTQLKLEKEKVSPKQLISYYFWAEDKGPGGEVRRAMSDLFFADVRDFEDIFREGEPPPGQPEQPQGQTDKLVDLQKQVVNATWRVVRDTQAGRSMETAVNDVEVVQQSQEIALNQTKEAMEKAKDEEIKTALTEAWKSMKDALPPLAQAQAEKKATPLPQALTFEQSALEWLHRAQSREHLVVRQTKSSKSAGKQSNQQELLNLELKQPDQRYEEDKKATVEEAADQKENLQVLNRLKELARRQEALAEKMKELKNQLAKAQTQEERSELENQLQHIQEEQEQLLRDVDDLKERMEMPENASNMAEAKEQLEQTREKLLDTSEKLKQGQLSEASNAATRAQRDLDKMQEDFRQKTAKQFADEMKQLRNQARQTAENQKKINEALETQKTPGQSQDTSAALQNMLNGAQVAQQLDEQSAKVKDLLESMRRISEQAEGNNPLLHQSLYETVREAQTGGLEKNLTKARDEARGGRRAEAQDAEHKASVAVDDLKKGVEKAAESVLGSESQALQMAKAELDKLIKEAQKEDKAKEAEMSEPAEASTPPEVPQPSLAQVSSKGMPPEDQPPAEASPPPKEEAKDGKAKGSEPQPADPNSKPTKEGALKPGTQPGNPGESKDKFATDSPSQKPGERAGEGMAQNKPGEGAPQEDGKGVKQPPQQPKGQASSTSLRSNPNLPPSGGQPSQSSAPPKAGPGPSLSQQTSQDSGNEGEQGTSPGRKGGNKGSEGKSEFVQNGGQNAPKGSVASAKGDKPGKQTGANSNNDGTGGRKRGGGGMFFDESAEQENSAPLTGNGYGQWSDRLRNVEELLSSPELRNEAAKVLDQARSMRIDHERNNLVPQVDHLRLRIIQPLVELRDRVAEELAKRNTGNPTVPVDRDPVPPAFRELVRRYYTELGAGK